MAFAVSINRWRFALARAPAVATANSQFFLSTTNGPIALTNAAANHKMGHNMPNEMVGMPVGQIVSRMNEMRSAKQVVFDMFEEYIEVTQENATDLEDSRSPRVRPRAQQQANAPTSLDVRKLASPRSAGVFRVTGIRATPRSA